MKAGRKEVTSPLLWAPHNTSKRVKGKGYSPWTESQSNRKNGMGYRPRSEGFGCTCPRHSLCGQWHKPDGNPLRHSSLQNSFPSGIWQVHRGTAQFFMLPPPWETDAERCWSSFHYSIGRFRVILGDGLGCRGISQGRKFGETNISAVRSHSVAPKTAQ